MNPIQIAAVTCVPMKTRLRLPVRHAAARRSYNDALLVGVRDHEGHWGFGECLPRAYVTGETMASATAAIENRWGPAACQLHFSTPDPYADLIPLYRQASLDRSLAAYGAIDLAIHDLLRRRGLGLKDKDHSPHNQQPRTFTIPLGWPITATTSVLRWAGFHDLKFKIDSLADLDVIAALKQRQPTLRIRVDANGALPPKEVVITTLVEKLGSHIWAIEAPFPRKELQAMATLQARTSCAVIADESLCTYEEAIAHRDMKAAHIWNLRLGKNGGITGVRQLIELAEQANIGMGFGVLVGETKALSESHAAMASRYPFLFVESGFNKLLVRGDPLAKAIAKLRASHP